MEAGVTVMLPPVEESEKELPSLPATDTVDAFCAATVRVELCPEEIVVGFAVMLTLGAVLVLLPTAMLSDEEKKKPLESQARMTTLCVPFASATEALSWLLELFAEFTESTYRIIAVTGCSLSSAAAVNWTGEATVEPAAGEQMFTVRSVVAEQPEEGGGGGEPLPTVMLSEEEKKKPLESQARMTMLCVRAASVTEATSSLEELCAVLVLSTYRTMAVTGCSLSSAPASNCTGDATLEPAAGEQILTVRSTVAVQAALAA